MRRLLGTAVLAIVALGATTNVSAETIYDQGKRIYTTYLKPASNPYTAYRNLSDSQERAVNAYLNVTHVHIVNTSPVRQTSARITQTGTIETCYSQDFSVGGRGYLDNAVWTFTQTASWCWKNGLITSGHFSRTGRIHALFWEYKGVTETDDYGGVGKTHIGRYSQAKFQLCVVAYDLGCIQNDNPWIDQDMYARTTGVENGGL